MDIPNLETSSIEKAKNLHVHFPCEVHEFFAYLKLYIKYFSDTPLSDKLTNHDAASNLPTYRQQHLLNCLDRYQELMDNDALAFGYLLFQPSSAKFVEKCIVSYAAHSDCSQHFKHFVNAYYL
ncbi:hypothetical protein G6M26_27310 [Agrobacterium tumefaciens]|nr:hypothetical protein [Agrobacterium tumefaciens]NTE22264.1 hypothetical protein [Agrobacterium tumefaciens]